MPENVGLIAFVILVASLAAVVSSRLHQLPMVGYVVAGIILGPHALRQAGEVEIRFIAELGVIVLLFVIGMELPLESFKRTHRTSLPLTFLLVLLNVGVTFALTYAFRWSVAESLVYAFVISLSSTAVGVTLLKQLHLECEDAGQVALGTLIIQDLIFVPMIITINAMGGDKEPPITFFLQIGLVVVAVIALTRFLLRKVKVHLIFETWIEKHEDLIPVAALSWCFVGAAISQKLGLSPAFGAFLSGLVIGNSHSKEKVVPKIQPMQSVLLMAFFVSIGMLIDLQVVWQSLGTIVFLVFASMLLKTTFAMALFRMSLPRSSWRCSYVAGLAIAQIGEFSFVLASTAAHARIVSEESYKILVAVIAITLAVSPLWLALMKRFAEEDVHQSNSGT